MIVEKWLTESTRRMKGAGIETARLDCLVLLQDALQINRAYILAHPEHIIESHILRSLNKKLTRRIKHEPLAYIIGKTEFYGREFEVNNSTLEPRPETETIIDMLKKIVRENGWKTNNLYIADIGTGSGCLAITAKLELPEAKVFATDISHECIKIAKQNAKKLVADITFYEGDLLYPLPSTICHLPYAILANLPYVPDGHTINKAAMHEPRSAIFGGSDGLDVYRNLFQQIHGLRKKPVCVLTESLPFQHASLVQIAKLAGYKLHGKQELIQLFL